jgi:hypothetical protein
MYGLFLQVGRLSLRTEIYMLNEVVRPNVIHFLLMFLKVRILSWLRKARAIITTLLRALTRSEASFLQGMIPG